jgi:hypothetical protein
MWPTGGTMIDGVMGYLAALVAVWQSEQIVLEELVWISDRLGITV